MRPMAALLLVALTMVLVPLAEAKCCARKRNAGCCGCRRCNIFCCNCDGGCNRVCEQTTCNTGEWATCFFLAAACGAGCASNPEACEGCIEMILHINAVCAKCYKRHGSSGCGAKRGMARRALTASPHMTEEELEEEETSRAEFYLDVAGPGGLLDLTSFSAYLQSGMESRFELLMQSSGERSAAVAPTLEASRIEEIFAAYDLDGDGIISREEFDNPTPLTWDDVHQGKEDDIYEGEQDDIINEGDDSYN